MWALLVQHFFCTRKRLTSYIPSVLLGVPGRPFGLRGCCCFRFFFFSANKLRDNGQVFETYEDVPTPMQVTHISRVGGNLQIRKEDVRANIFKPTVALPTMTVEEFGEIELERARLQQVRYIGGRRGKVYRR